MSHSSLSSLYNAFNKAHANNIRIYPEKCFFFTKSARRQRTCREEEIVRKRRIVRHISLIFNEFKDAPLWFLCNLSNRLQNSLYFCIFKYVRAVKQKVWNKAENTPYGRVRLAHFARVRLLRHALPISLLILRKDRLFGGLFMYWVKCNGARMVLSPSLYLFRKEKKTMKGENEKSKSPFFMYSYWGLWTREKLEGRARREGGKPLPGGHWPHHPAYYLCMQKHHNCEWLAVK